MNQLSEDERMERIQFMVQRLKRGFSPLEVRNQFAKHYNCAQNTARRWMEYTGAYLSQDESPIERRFNYSYVIEMLHDQIVAYQSDIVTMQSKVNAIENIVQEKEALRKSIPNLPPTARAEATEKLKALGDFNETTIINMLEIKGRARDRMFRVMQELFTIRGVYAYANSDWRTAVNVLIDNGLIPANVAGEILQVIDLMESQVESAQRSLSEVGINGVEGQSPNAEE